MSGTRPRKRRRTPPSDWELPLLTHWGFQPKQQRLIVIIATAIGVLAGAVALVAVIGSLGTYTPERRASAAAVVQSGAALPRDFQGWASPKLFAPIGERAKDTQPLTVKEVFGQRALAGEKKLSLRLAGRKLDADCSAALWGEALIEQVSAAECTQAVRGLYLSSDRRYVGQYTLLNLRDGESAAALVESLETLHRGGWTLPLASTKAAFPAGGYTEAGAYALGHYVGLVWIGRADGAEPTARDDYVSLALTLRGAEKAIYRRVVAITGPAS